MNASVDGGERLVTKFVLFLASGHLRQIWGTEPVSAIGPSEIAWTTSTTKPHERPENEERKPSPFSCLSRGFVRFVVRTVTRIARRLAVALGDFAAKVERREIPSRGRHQELETIGDALRHVVGACLG